MHHNLELEPHKPCRGFVAFFFFSPPPAFAYLSVSTLINLLTFRLVLTSKWCRRFYTSERAGYEGMLGFLTQRYSRKAYLWELVV